MQPFAQQLDRIWREWLGIAHGPSLPAREPAASLFNPPNENLEGAAEPLLHASVDRYFHECAQQAGITPAPFWPDQRPYALCVTHDIDRILSTIHGVKEIRTGGWKALQRIGRDLKTAFLSQDRSENPFFNFQRMSHLEKEWGIRSASYVLFEKRRWQKAIFKGEWQHAIGVYNPASIFPALRAYESLGNEVGVHGSFDSWNCPSSLEQNIQTLHCGGIERVVGVRNHYLWFDPSKTLSAQTQAAVEYDSTLGFNYRAGFRCGTCFPFRLNSHWELPFQLMDSALRYQSSSFENRKKLVRSVQQEVQRQGGVLVVNWHLHVLNPDVFPQEILLLEQLVEQAKKDGAWIALPREVIAWWEGRVVSP